MTTKTNKAPHVWVITRDVINNDPGSGNASGMIGPSNAPMEDPNEISRHSKAKCFRMSDGDGMRYFYGKFVSVDDIRSDEFAPLDDFGRAFGCTTIEYLETKEVWVEL